MSKISIATGLYQSTNIGDLSAFLKVLKNKCCSSQSFASHYGSPLNLLYNTARPEWIKYLNNDNCYMGLEFFHFTRIDEDILPFIEHAVSNGCNLNKKSKMGASFMTNMIDAMVVDGTWKCIPAFGIILKRAVELGYSDKTSLIDALDWVETILPEQY